MKTRFFAIVLGACFLHAFSILVPGQDKLWRAVTTEDLQMKSPRVEADADAEVLFWEVRIADLYRSSGFKTTLTHYVRVKIFTERGRNEHNKVDIPYGKARDLGIEISISDIAARTIRSDGTTLEVKPADIFDRETVKARGVKFKARSFVMPGVDIGSIIEYRWTETRNDVLSYYVRLELSREIPVQHVKYYIKPVAGVPIAFRLHSINTSAGFQKEIDGFYSTSMSNVPSFKEEPHMPAEYDVRPWVLAYYEEGGDENDPPDVYWRTFGKRTHQEHVQWLAFNDKIKRAAEQIVGDAADPTERARRIFEHCRKNIVNVDDDAAGLKPDQLKNIKTNKTVADILSRSTGTRHDVLMLFGSMLASLGIDVRVANVAMRTDSKFDRKLANAYFIRSEVVAARIGGKWMFFDPGNRYIPFGSLLWSQEGQAALVSDADQPVFVDTPVTQPERSKQTRTAKLRVSEDGSIEGDVHIEFTGHLAWLYKENNDDWSPAQREKSLVEMIKRQTVDTAEITAVSIENVTDPEKPFIYDFHIRVPSYAEKTGKRLFLNPGLLERGSKPVFSKSARQYDIWFDYPWSEHDDFSIELPKGYGAESLESPPVLKDGPGNTILETRYETAAASTLRYRRTFSFGNNLTLEFDSARYERLKQLFDSFHRSDTLGVMLLKTAQ